MEQRVASTFKNNDSKSVKKPLNYVAQIYNYPHISGILQQRASKKVADRQAYGLLFIFQSNQNDSCLISVPVFAVFGVPGCSLAIHDTRFGSFLRNNRFKRCELVKHFHVPATSSLQIQVKLLQEQYQDKKGQFRSIYSLSLKTEKTPSLVLPNPKANICWPRVQDSYQLLL